ncbi:MAG: PAS domain-containing protein [Deltaproteobacteria bacterium]|nr:PAS domain-containing protein [Deltaproteobacteria bacterium]
MLGRFQPAGFRVDAPPRLQPDFDASRLSPAERHVAFVAALLEGLADWHEARPISRNLDAGPRALARSLESLPLYRRSELAKRIGPAALAELSALASEADPELFLQGLMNLARRLHGAGDAALAAALPLSLRRSLQDHPEWRGAISPAAWADLNRECDVVQGRGPIAPRVEFLLRHFAREVSHPATLASFAAGAGAFQSLRLLTLARLTTASAGLATRAWRARALASLAGLGGETFALTLSHRSLREALGERQAWDAESIRRELLVNGITLGLMRGAGAASESAFRGLHGIGPGASRVARLSEFASVSRVLIPQTAMLGALLFAHRTESALGLRPAGDGATVLFDSLATLLHFNIGGRIFESLQPRGFGAWTRGLEAQSRALASGSAPRSGSGGDFGAWRPRGDFAWALADRAPREPRRAIDDIVAMNERPEDEGGIPRPAGLRPESVTAPNPVRFREVLEASPHPVLVVDPQGEIRYANGPARRIFQPTLLDFANIRIMEVFEPHPSEPGLFVWSRAQNDLTYWRMENRNLGGEEGFVAHFLTDVTELQVLKGRAAALQEQNVRLEAKSQLAERFLHDGGNLLSDLSFREGLLERLVGAQGAAGESSRWGAFADRVRDLGSSVGKVMDFYRSWRRIAAGNPRQVTVLSMEPMLNEALRLNEGARLKQGIRLETDFGSEALTVRGEEALLINAVLNLLVNACHAMPEGGTLRVRTYPREAFVVIEVSDTGIGIPPEYLPHIFEFGFTTKQHSGGTGLGLPNVRTAVESLHRGRVEVESRVGEGTTFRLFLPSSAQ